MCMHSYSLSHEKSEKKWFGLLPVLCIRVCLLRREAVVTVATRVYRPICLKYFGPRASQSFNPVLILTCTRKLPVKPA